tara:strand:- start:559 stop:1572 length:1014 start_codon:yes stop_codon:yes gene_type:complete
MVISPEEFNKNVEDMRVEMKHLKAEVRKAYNKLSKQQSTEALIGEAVQDALKGVRITTAPVSKRKEKRTKKPKSAPEAWLCLSDWQVGKVTETYNSQVATRRVHQLTNQAADLIRKENPKVLHIVLQGDMVEGEAIFAGQPFEIDDDLWTQSVKTVPKLITHVITKLSPLVPKIKVAAVHGNHGRSGFKGGGHSRKTNWDLVSYNTAELMCQIAGVKNMSWEISETWFVKQKVAGNGILCVHGDQIGGGNPFNVNAIFKKAMGWTHNIEDWKFLSVGHHHTHASGELNRDMYFFLSGSPESGNEFAREKLAQGGLALQRLCFFNSKGLISEHLLKLT